MGTGVAAAVVRWIVGCADSPAVATADGRGTAFVEAVAVARPGPSDVVAALRVLLPELGLVALVLGLVLVLSVVLAVSELGAACGVNVGPSAVGALEQPHSSATATR